MGYLYNVEMMFGVEKIRYFYNVEMMFEVEKIRCW